MIKVNLLRDTTAVTQKKGGKTFATGFGEGTRVAEAPQTKDVVAKIIFVIIPVIGAFAGFSYVEGQHTAQLEAVRKMTTAKTDEVKKLGSAIEAVKNFKKEKDKLQVQIDTIKNLSHERLRNVKALEALQNILPEKVWLTKLKILENKAQLEGRAVDDKLIADFMAALEENIYFVNVKLLKSAEEQAKDGVVKSFEVECNLEGM